MRPHRRKYYLTRRRIRWRALLWTLAGAAFAVGLLVGAHKLQVPRVASKLAKNADLFEREGKPADAVSTIRLLAAMNPEDVEVEERLAILLSRLGNSRADAEANNRLRQLLRRSPDRPASRAALLELCLKYGDLVEARRQAQALEAAADSRDSAAFPIPWKLIARLYQASDDPRKAADAFQKAIDANPRDFESYQRLADLYALQLKDSAAVMKLVERLIESNPTNPMAHLIAYVVRRDHALGAADAALDAALKFGPQNVEVRLMAAGRELSRNPAAAREHLELAKQIAPDDVRISLALGRLLAARRDYAGALRQFEEGFEKSNRSDAELAWRAAEILVETNRTQTLPKYLAALSKDVRFRPVSAFLRARLDLIQGKPEPAATGFIAAKEALDSSLLQGAPTEYRREIGYKIELGYAGACFQLGDLDAALAAAEKAGDINPSEPLPLLTIAAIRQQRRQFVDAADAYRAALAKPGCPPSAYFSLAQSLLLEQQNRPADERQLREFVAALDQLERTVPNLPELPQLKADYFIASNRIEEAISALKAGVQAHPGNPATAISLVRTLAFARRFDEARALNDRIESRFGQSIASTLSLVQIDLDLGKPEDAGRRIDAVMTTATADRKIELMIPRAQVAWFEKDAVAAAAEFDRLAELDDPDHFFRAARFDFLLETAGPAAVRARLDELSKGAPDFKTWAEAWLAAFESPNPAGDVRARHETLRGSRPFWWGTQEMEALLEELNGSRPKAIRLYRRALLAGPAFAFAAERLLNLQIEERRLDDARDFLGQLRLRRLPRPADVRLNLEYQAASGNSPAASKQAAELAQRHGALPLWKAWFARIQSRSE